MNLEEISGILELCKESGYSQREEELREIYLMDFNKAPVKVSNKNEWEIENEWKRYNQQLVSQGKKPFFNGNIVVLKLMQRTMNGAGFLFGVSDYKHYLGAKNLGLEEIWAIGTGGLTTFEDERGGINYIFAKKLNEEGNEGGKIEAPPGGYLDFNLFNKEVNRRTELPEILKLNLLKEFGEEIIPEEGIIQTSLLAFSKIGEVNQINGERTRFNDADFIYHIHLDKIYDLNGFTGRLASTKKYSKEHSQIIVVPDNELLEFLRKNQGNLSTRLRENLSLYFNTKIS